MGQARERRFLLKQFKAISQAISTYEDMNLLLNHLAEGVSRAFSIMGARILMYDEKARELYKVGGYGLDEEYGGDRHLPDNDKCKECIKQVVVFDRLEDENCVNYLKEASSAGINFIISIPIKFRQTSVGVLRLYNDEAVMFHEEDIGALETLTCQLGMAIELNGLKNVVCGIHMSLETLPSHTLQCIQSTR